MVASLFRVITDFERQQFELSHDSYLRLANDIAFEATPVVPVYIYGQMEKAKLRPTGALTHIRPGPWLSPAIIFVDRDAPFSLEEELHGERTLKFGNSTLYLHETNIRKEEVPNIMLGGSYTVAHTCIQDFDDRRVLEYVPDDIFSDSNDRDIVSVGWEAMNPFPHTTGEKSFGDYLAGTPASEYAKIATTLSPDTRDLIRDEFGVIFDPEIVEDLRQASRAIYSRYGVQLDNVLT